MKKVSFRRKKNNAGSTIIIVLLMTSFVLILATLITTTTMINLRMKLAASQATKSFYTSEEAVDEIQAALGKISVSCFNRAYEEQLTRIFSYNQVESGSSEESDTKLVNINNKKANEDLRVNYMKYLLLELKLKTEAETTNMPSILTTSVIGKWDKTKDNNVNGTSVSSLFVRELNSYIEDYVTLKNVGTALEVESISVINMSVTNDTTTGAGSETSGSTAATGLPVYAVEFKDCVVKYLNENGDYSYITFDGSLGLPDIYIDFRDENLVGTLFFADYSLIGNRGISLNSGSATINGHAYAGAGHGLNVTNGANLTVGSNKYMICGGTFSIFRDKTTAVALANTKKGSIKAGASNFTLGSGAELWAKEIVVGNNGYITAESGSDINLEDDITIEGNYSNVEFNSGSSFSGYGYEDPDSAKESPYRSSALIVNGEHSKIIFSSGLSKLVVAGRAYIKFENEVSVATGESVSVNTNQEIYMIPADLIVSGKNPSTRKEGDPNVSLNIEINQSNFFGYDLLNKTSTGADDFIETRDLKIKANESLGFNEDQSRTYYYFKFKSRAARNTYANLIYGTEDEFVSYVMGLDYYKSLPANAKTTYLIEAKKLWTKIRTSVDSYARVSDSAIGIEHSDGEIVRVNPYSSTGSNWFSANGNYDFKGEFTDRECRYNVFNKILAPLESGTKYTSTSQAQTYLSNKDDKYALIDLNKYIEGDIYGNVINKKGFDKLTASSAFCKTVDSKVVIVFRNLTNQPLVIKSGSETKISGYEVTLATTKGIIVTNGNVRVECDFNGIILSDKDIEITDGCTLSNTTFDASFGDGSLWKFVEDNSKADGAGNIALRADNGELFKDIFRYWNPKVGSDDDSSIKVGDMTYRDMVRVSKWRKYDDPERYIEESSKASAT